MLTAKEAKAIVKNREQLAMEKSLQFVFVYIREMAFAGENELVLFNEISVKQEKALRVLGYQVKSTDTIKKNSSWKTAIKW